MNHPPGYRIEWRAARYGVRSHVLVLDVHDQVATALIEDPNGAPWTLDEVANIARHVSSQAYARRERPGDKRCEFCVRAIAELDSGIAQARENWAIGQLAAVLEKLAELAPIGPPEHVISE
jgi:hypothetical protein